MAEVVGVALGWDFLGIQNGDFLFWARLKKSPGIGNLESPKNLEICIPGIGDFSKSGDFYPGD